MLAQDWLYGDRLPTRYDAYLEKCLQIPDKFNPHSSVSVLNNIAERIVFSDDVPSLLYDMYDNKQITYEGLLRTVKLPFDNFWLEYASSVGLEGINAPFNKAYYGALVQRMPNDTVGMILVTGFAKTDRRHYDCGITHVIEFKHWPPVISRIDKPNKWALAFEVLHAFNKNNLEQADNNSLYELSHIVCEILFGIFLVTHTKVYEAEQVTWGEKHRRARAKRGKPPLLEYRRIRVRISKGRKVYAQRPAIDTSNAANNGTDSDAAIQHRRYHKVMGHFRHYIKHDPPYTVWIESHYRGDPALGVTFTERDVTR